MGSEYVALGRTIWEDCEADKRGHRMVLVQHLSHGSASVTPWCITLGAIQYKIALKTTFLLHLHAVKEEA